MRHQRRRLVALSSASLLAVVGLAFSAPAVAAICLAPGLSSDFDNDGNSDAAFGEPFRNVGADIDAGGVDVLYGTDTGLTSTGADIFTQDTAGLATSSSPDEDFGFLLASGDFDEDCDADLAIASPGDTTHGLIVLFGSPSGLSGTSNERYDIAGIQAMASGDFNGDNADDLAVGIEGSVRILMGQDGVGLVGGSTFTQATAGVPGADEAGDHFGTALASDDFDGDDRFDLAIGAWGEDIGSSSTTQNAGSVTVLMGSNLGLTTDGALLFTQDTPGVPGGAESDHFGEALAAAEFDNDGQADLAIGSPEESIGPDVDTGSVTILHGGDDGPSAAESEAWNQDTPGVPGANENGDRFGSALTTGEFTGEGYFDLAIGAWGENVGSIVNAGSVTILYSDGPDGGLVTTGAEAITQDTPGVLGGAETGDHFGRVLEASPVTGSGMDDLIVGVPGEDTGGRTDDGLVHLLLSDAEPPGVTTAGDQTWTREAIDGAGQSGAQFGRGLG